MRGDLGALLSADPGPRSSPNARISRNHQGTVSTATPTSVAAAASSANRAWPRLPWLSRNTAIPLVTSAIPASTRSSAILPPPKKAPESTARARTAAPAGPLAGVGLPPHDAGTDQGDPQRSGHPATPRGAPRGPGQCQAPAEQDQTDPLLPIPCGTRPPGTCLGRRQERPQQRITDQSGATETGKRHEDHPYPQHRHTEVLGDPAGHTGDDPVRPMPTQPCRPRHRLGVWPVAGHLIGRCAHAVMVTRAGLPGVSGSTPVSPDPGMDQGYP